MAAGKSINISASSASAQALLKQRSISFDPKVVEDFSKHWFKSLPMHYKENISTDQCARLLASSWEMLSLRGEKGIAIRANTQTEEIEEGLDSELQVINIACEDHAFLTESIRIVVKEMGCVIRRYYSISSLCVSRADNGMINSLINPDKCSKKEMFCQIWLQVPENRTISAITKTIDNVISQIQLANQDWGDMQAQMQKVMKSWEDNQEVLGLETEDFNEAKEFLKWMQQHFVFLGSRTYRLMQGNIDKKPSLHYVNESDKGILLDKNYPVVNEYPFLDYENDIKDTAWQRMFYFTKSGIKTSIKRSEYADLLGIRIFNAQAQVYEEIRFVGLLSSYALDSNPSEIPVVRKKILEITRIASDCSTYYQKQLTHIVRNLPTNELFQAKASELYRIAIGDIDAETEDSVRMFIRTDVLGGFYTASLTLPREYFSTSVRIKVSKYLTTELNAEHIQSVPRFTSSDMVSVYFIIKVAKIDKDIKTSTLEKAVKSLIEPWSLKLKKQLQLSYGAKFSQPLISKYVPIFTPEYIACNSPQQALYDIKNLNDLCADISLKVSMQENKIYHNYDKIYSVKLYLRNRELMLSDVVPVLENMGFRVLLQQRFYLEHDKGQCHYNIIEIQVFCEDKRLDLTAKRRDEVLSMLYSVLQEEVHNDSLNALPGILSIKTHDVEIIRAYIYYIDQLGLIYSKAFMRKTCLLYPGILQKWIELWHARFMPENDDCLDKQQSKYTELLHAIDSVDTLNEDSFLRCLAQCLLATMRTNFYQKNRQAISLKLYPENINAVPKPRPKIETFVFCSKVVGIHLRMSKVSRGGIRWSNREEDFRDEVLGLMFAQELKNSVVAPDGGKGAFIVTAKSQSAENGIQSYSMFIQALLDITDQIKAEKIISPDNTRIYDNEDSYLVVAADKGTASYSNIANGIALQKEYWLGDAFASGGEFGYDHRKLGITARGAWQSLEWHLSDAKIDIEQTDISMIGIGDMSGDVFGNGLLMSKKIKLLAAFDHRDIFIDPNPNAKQSYIERQRLSQMPHSSWQDYDNSHLSPGGGVYSRTCKYIDLSPQIQEIFELSEKRITPNELIQKILTMKVDILWNGGIGTYIRCENENDQDIQDPHNSSTRVVAQKMQTKIIVEGGNLGLSQKARVSYALQGGCVNADFIDNAGGVICSDYEVNIKILLQSMLEKQEITVQKRNELLLGYTDEVTNMVLGNIKELNVSMSLTAMQVKEKIQFYMSYIDYLKAKKHIDLEKDELPTGAILESRLALGKNLTRPELAVLLARVKIVFIKDLLQSELINDPHCIHFLQQAFPLSCVEQFSDNLQKHPLKSKIIATRIADACVRDMGLAYCKQMTDELDCSIDIVFKSYLVSIEIFQLRPAMKELLDVCKHASNATKRDNLLSVYLECRSLLRQCSQWLIQNHHIKPTICIKKTASIWQKQLQAVIENIEHIYDESVCKEKCAQQQHLVDAGITPEAAALISSLKYCKPILEVLGATAENSYAPHQTIAIAKLYRLVCKRFKAPWLRNQITHHPISSIWDDLEKSALTSTIDHQMLILSQKLVTTMPECPDHNQVDDKLLDSLLEGYKDLEHKWHLRMEEVYKVSNHLTFSVYAVTVKKLTEMCEQIH